MALPRPAQVLTALKRLGYQDKPSVGDHVSAAKLLDHPEGPVTIKTGLDMGHCSKRDVARIQRQTKLKGEMWDKALAGDLSRADYHEHLRSIPKPDLLPPWWKAKFEEEAKQKAKEQGKGKGKGKGGA